MKVHVIYTHDGKWWTAEAPSIPGAYSQGRTRQSAWRNLLGAIQDLRETYEASGARLPRAREVKVELAELEA